MLSILLTNTSAAVMNVISADEAVSIFPRLTLIDRTSFITTRARHANSYAWIKKYTLRGFSVTSNRMEWLNADYPSYRYIGDKYCLRVILAGTFSDSKGARLNNKNLTNHRTFRGW